MSDWFAVYTGIALIEAGLDIDMPGLTLPTLAGLLGGKLTEYNMFFSPNVSTAVTNSILNTDCLDNIIT